MKKTRISMYEICQMLPSQVDERIRSKLKAEGFDMSKEIVSEQDIFMGDMVFKQYTEGIERSGS